MTEHTTLPTVLTLGGGIDDRTRISAALAPRYDCLESDDASQAWRLMADHFVQVVICAGPVRGSDCGDIFDRLQSHWPETLLVAITGEGSQDAPASAHQLLPFDWTEPQLERAVDSAVRLFRLTRENERLALEMRVRRPVRGYEPTAEPELGFESILRSPTSPMTALVAAARQFASFDVPLLLTGEPGTGKADFAKAIHLSSMRSDKPFQAFDCTGHSEEATAVALFGLRKSENGSPPVSRAGLIRKADHGTLYIAGIETLSPALQLRLLRLARDGSYEQTGLSDPQSSGARIITGAAADLHTLIDAGSFRADLYYALSVGELAIPPLRNRTADLALLARAIAEAAGRRHGKAVHGISPDVMGFLTAYDWPGNLRELENEVTRMLILAQDPVLGPDLISRHILQAAPAEEGEHAPRDLMAADGPLKTRIEAIEARILRETLTRLKWNKSRSAAELGLSRVGLRAKLDRYGITPPQPEKEEA